MMILRGSLFLYLIKYLFEANMNFTFSSLRAAMSIANTQDASETSFARDSKALARYEHAQRQRTISYDSDDDDNDNDNTTNSFLVPGNGRTPTFPTADLARQMTIKAQLTTQKQKNANGIVFAAKMELANAKAVEAAKAAKTAKAVEEAKSAEEAGAVGNVFTEMVYYLGSL